MFAPCFLLVECAVNCPLPSKPLDPLLVGVVLRALHGYILNTSSIYLVIYINIYIYTPEYIFIYIYMDRSGPGKVGLLNPGSIQESRRPMYILHEGCGTPLAVVSRGLQRAER